MARPKEYTGFFAEFYDILHAGLSDVDAYVRYAKQFGAPHRIRILELGCGTGRILVPLAHAGFRATGIDISDDMLGRCEIRLGYEEAAVRERTRTVKADVRDFDLGEEYDLVIAPCNMLAHFVQTQDLMSVLWRAKAHLKDSGTFMLDLSVPNIPYMVAINGVTRKYEFVHPLTGTDILDYLTATYDFTRQIEKNRIALEEYSEGLLVRREKTEAHLTYFFPREVRLMLWAAGFKIVREQGSLEKDIPIDDKSGEMVFFCQKR